MKYIDSEKLKIEIEKLLARANRRTDKEHLSHNIQMEKFGEDYWNGYGDFAYALLGYITSLQQEQPMPDSTKLIEFWNEDKEMLKEMDFRDDVWRLAYNAYMCGFGRGVSVKRQKQPEVDLEKEVKSYIKHNFTITDEVAEIPEEDRRYSMWEDDMRAFAEHFYNLALADVREMITRQQKANHTGTDEWIRAKSIAYESVCDFIDNLTK